MSAENFKNTTEGWKNIALLLAIIVGGGWSLYVFHSKFESESALAQLRKIEQELEQFPVVKASMNSFVITDQTANYLKVIVTLTNDGSRKTRVYLDESVLRVSNPVFKDGRVRGFSDVVYSKMLYPPPKGKAMHKHMAELTLFPGHSKDVVFIVKVNKIGLYQVMFAGRPGGDIVEEREAIDSTYIKPEPSQIIYAMDYISVIGDRRQTRHPENLGPTNPAAN